MTLRLTFLVLFLCAFARPVFSQEWFRGVYYEPLPVHELDTLLPADAGVSDMISYDAATRTEKIHPAAGLPGGLSGTREAPGAEGAFPLGASPGAGDRNFGDLTLVNDAAVYPNRTAVKMYMSFPNGKNYVGSGAMINARFVLTAAHCIHDKNLGGWASSVTVVPAYSNGAEPFGSANEMTMHTYTKWVSDRDFSWDIGFIQLDRYVGAMSGWLGYGYNTSNDFIKSKSWHNFSYPAESPYNGERMYYRTGAFDEVGSRVAYYKKPGFGGMSGSALYYNANGSRYAYLVHSHTTNNTKAGCVRLDGALFDKIQDEIKSVTPNSANISPLWVRSSTRSMIAGCESIGRLSFLVFNYSEAAIDKTVPFRVYLSTDAVIGTGDRLLKTQNIKVKLDPNSGAWFNIDNVAIPANVGGGNYFVGIFIDLNDGLKSDNNTRGIDSDPVTIYPARQLTLNVTTDSLPAGAGCMTLQLNSNTDWSIEADAPWVTSISPSSGYGTRQIEICYAANTGVRDRKSVITVRGDCVTNKKTTLVQHFTGIHVFPNPVIDRLQATYTLPETSDVRITLYAADGKTIKNLVDTTLPAGDYEIDEILPAMPAGIYILCMVAGDQVVAKRVVKG